MRSVPLCTMAFAAVVSCGGDDLLLPGDAAPARIAIAAGDGQNGRVGSTLAESISVLVSDATGRPVMGQAVAFAVTAGDGASLIPDTALTGADGRAGARWVLGRTAGTQRAQAELVTTDPAAPVVVFSAAAAPGNPAVLVRAGGNDQSAPAGTLLSDSLVVRVQDEFGNPVSGADVNWTVSGGGSVTPPRVTSSASGRAAARRLLGSQAGEQGATASINGVAGSQVAFTHSATGGGGGGGGGDGGGGGNQGSAISIVSGNDQRGPPGGELPNPLVVRVTDAAGRAVSGASVVWVVTDGGGSVRPGFAVTDGGGRASTRWTLGSDEGRNRVNAVVSGVGTAAFEASARRSGGGGGGGGGGGRGGGGDDDDDDDDD